MYETLKNWDRELFVWLNSLGIEDYDRFWIFATQISSWTPLFIVFFILLFYFKGWKKGAIAVLFLILTFAVTIYFTNFIKDYIQRLRPNNVEALSTLIRILQKPENYSFFSGHASSSFSIVTFLCLALRAHSKWIYITYIWPLIFVMSRIYVGVHYPSDIVVGAFVGTCFAFVFYAIFKRIIQLDFFKSSP